MMTESMTARLIQTANGRNEGLEMRVQLVYAPLDPYALHLSFKIGLGWVRWVFARELLADGMIFEAGQGDVRIIPDEDTIDVVLDSPSGTARLAFSRADFERALDVIEGLVPTGTEHEKFDFDREIAKLGDLAA